MNKTSSGTMYGITRTIASMIHRVRNLLFDSGARASGAGERMTRPTADAYFLEMAQAAAGRGTCDRAKVGAVVVRNGHVQATGYNGAERGAPHCDQVGHDMVNGHCVRALHAEDNAMSFAGLSGTAGATLYVTHLPCKLCARKAVNMRVLRVVYAQGYREGGARILVRGGIQVEHYQIGGKNE